MALKDSADSTVLASTLIRPQDRKLHDPNVTFEEYHYYALRTRQDEKDTPAEKTNWMQVLVHRDTKHQALPPDADGNGDVNFSNQENRINISDKEWMDASRAFRTATCGACFFLITTDIIGPFGVGFAMGTLGWGPGIALYTVFGFMAGYSGYLLWKVFLGLDSNEFPLKHYGDLAFRVYGTTARYCVNILQVLSLLLVVGQETIQQGEGLSQISRFRLCYAVCPVIFIVAGFGIGQVRTLRNYGWLASLAVWLNMLTVFISMGAIAHSPPNYAISVLGSAGGLVDPASITPDDAGNYPPVIHYGALPDPSSLVGSLNGLLTGVYAYGGAQLFVEFMAEMKRPRDFLKAMWGAQFFIYSVYLIYGSYVYYFQGQYAYQLSYQGVSLYGWQTAGNMLTVLSGLIAAGLFGNIGIKVLYNNVLMDVFNAPPLTTRKGKILWAIIVPIWWTISFIIAAAIPDYFGFVSVVSAATIMQFTYSFPPLIALGYEIRLAAMRRDGEGFDPTTGQVHHTDMGVRRWIRGFFAGPWYLNVFHVLYAIGSLAMAGLGLYAAVEGMVEAFKIPQVNAFSCTSPLDLSGSG